jgi:hypothetical protein
MRKYTPMNYNVVALIHQDPTYKKMTSDDMLGRIINHEMYIEEANHIKIFTRVSQPPRNKTLLSKLATRARRRL